MEARLDIQEDPALADRPKSSAPTIIEMPVARKTYYLEEKEKAEKDNCILISGMLITATILTEFMLAMAGYAAGRAIDESSDLIKILSTLAVMLIASGFIVSSTLVLRKHVPEDIGGTSVNPASFFSRAHKMAYQNSVLLAPLTGSIFAICFGGLAQRFFREPGISTFRPEVTRVSSVCAIAFLGFSIPVVAAFIALQLMKKSNPSAVVSAKEDETTPLTLATKPSYMGLK